MTVSERIYEQIRRLAAGEIVEGVSWGLLTRYLNNAMTDYREAAVRAAQAQNARLEAEAIAAFDQTKAVWDAITEVYRMDPEFGLDARGRLNGAPVVLFPIAMIITAAGLVAWAMSNYESGRALRATAEAAISACELHGPGSPECNDATQRAREVADRLDREKGLGEQIGEAAGGIAWLLVAAAALLVAGRRR